MTHEQQTAQYIRQNFEPDDRIALVVLGKQDGSTLQRITSADNAASPKYQAWLRAENAKGRDIYVMWNRPVQISFLLRPVGFLRIGGCAGILPLGGLHE